MGSALRLMTTRLREAGAGAEGVIVVPDDPSTQWWTMTRYFSVEGRLRAGAEIQASLTAKRCEKEDVELQMGWQLRKHAKEMRLHYAERGARACRARMTEMI